MYQENVKDEKEREPWSEPTSMEARWHDYLLRSAQNMKLLNVAW
jgi:hypothetical protein